ncbi:MAG TPA: hypothetical protein VGP72_21325 [Planctomycetota bacterium]|jgi:hypothetical protein
MTITPQAFVQKWGASTLKESAAYSEHFCDLCRLVGQPTPAEADPKGEFFTFQKGVIKDLVAAPLLLSPRRGGAGGEVPHGFADVWYKEHFAWEYKGKHEEV